MPDREGLELDMEDNLLALAIYAELDKGKKVFLQHPASDAGGMPPTLERRDPGLIVQTGITIKVVTLAWGDEKVVERKSLPGFKYTTVDQFIMECRLIAKARRDAKAKTFVLEDDYRKNARGDIAFYLRSR